jgi:choline dehydrogenase-like flavoprotein
MGSMPLGSKRVDKFGRLVSNPNFYVMDASALPSETVESPQGSIMQMAFHLAGKAGDDLARDVTTARKGK